MRIAERYAELVAAGELKPDGEQAAAALRLDRLQDELENPAPPPGIVGRLLGKRPTPSPRGLSHQAARLVVATTA